MGPMTIFDKSFLQALNPDEAALFDVLFMTNITPLFFVETLADLEKEIRDGRTAEAVVGNLAYKTPKLRPYPNVGHWALCQGELLGEEVEMSRRPIVGQGRPVMVGNEGGIVFDFPSEAEAFARWERGNFLDVERQYAKIWRALLSAMPKEVERLVGKDGQKIKFHDLAEIKILATNVFQGSGKRWQILKMVLSLLRIPAEGQTVIVSRWKKLGGPPLSEFAPYTAHVLTVDLFFQLAISTGHISAERPSNRVDIAYLYYLPFTEIFVSGDNLHERTAPLFMNDKQLYVSAQDLKADLKKLDAHYSNHPDIPSQGLMSVASAPPMEGDFLTAKLFDRFRPKWRASFAKPLPPDPERDAKLVQKLKRFTDAGSHASVTETGRQSTPPIGRIKRSTAPLDSDAMNVISFERRVPLRWGKWQFLPPSVAKPSEGGDQKPVG